MDPNSDSTKPPVQFGIGRLMVITTLVAIIMAISVRMNAPRIAQGLFAGYLFFFAIWAVVRGPTVFADLADINKKRLLLKQRRGELEREYQRRLEHRERTTSESDPSKKE